jgi:heme/copper-type cytochrome/quinol oxidase subunit 3
VSATDLHAHVGRRFLDVSHLGTVVHGHRDPLWWGVMLLMAIEGTMFALLAASYGYLRGNESVWPPTGAIQPPISLTLATVVILILSGVSMAWAFRAASHDDLRNVRLGMIVTTILSAVALIPRGYEFAMLGYKWNSHAYGSIVWAIYFMHTFHLVSGVIENMVLTTLLYKGPVEKKHMLDARLGGYYWWFVVVSWVLLWALIFGDTLLQR